jgi:hypothetical protein
MAFEGTPLSLVARRLLMRPACIALDRPAGIRVLDGIRIPGILG